MGIPVHKVPGPEQRPPNSDFTSPSSLQPQRPAPPSNATGTTYAVSPPSQASQAQREGPAPQGRATWGGSPALHLGPAGPSLLCSRGAASRTTNYSGISLKTQAEIVDNNCLWEKQNSETHCWCSGNPAAPFGARVPRGAGRGTRSLALGGGSPSTDCEAKPRPPLHPGPPLRRPHFPGPAPSPQGSAEMGSWRLTPSIRVEGAATWKLGPGNGV